MVITYYGDNYFRIQSGQFTVLVDPVNARSFKGSQIIISTVKPALVPRESTKEEEGVWIENQGEYEAQGVSVYGWTTHHEEKKEHTLYLLTLEEINIMISSRLTEALAPELIEKVKRASQNEDATIDICILPGGGSPYLSETQAVKCIRLLEPALIIPSCITKEPKKLLQELDRQAEQEEKVVMKKKDLTSGAMQVRYCVP